MNPATRTVVSTHRQSFSKILVRLKSRVSADVSGASRSSSLQMPLSSESNSKSLL